MANVPANNSYERIRAAWSKICDVTISSSAPVRSTNAWVAALTVAERADRRASQHRAKQRAKLEREGVGVFGERRLELAGSSRAQRDERLHQRGGKQFAFGVAVGSEDVEAEHDVRRGELRFL